MTLQRVSRSGLFFNFNYSWSHAINEDTSGLGGPTQPQNVGCRSCDKANSVSDQRHSLHGSLSNPLPFGRSKRWEGWSISAVNSFHTGLPLNVTLSRKATDVPDGNTNNQRPDYVYGTWLIPANGQTIDHWINLAAFATPAEGSWGDGGRDIVTGPRLFQIDAALAKVRGFRSAWAWFSELTSSTCSTTPNSAVRIRTFRRLRPSAELRVWQTRRRSGPAAAGASSWRCA
jgi:hypothetical protein